MKPKVLLAVFISILFSNLLLLPQFARAEDYIRVISPNGQESFGLGETVQVKWNPGLFTGKVSIRLLKYAAKQPYTNTYYIQEEIDKAERQQYITSDYIANSGQYNWIIPADGKVIVGDYYRIYVQADGSADGDISDGTFGIFNPSTTTPPPQNTNAHYGKNILLPDGSVCFVSLVEQQWCYTSGGAFLSYSYNKFSDVITASEADKALAKGSFIPPRDGKIICSDRGSDKGTCYLITNGLKAGFTSEKVFKDLGFNFTNVLYADVSWMGSDANITSSTEAHRTGVLINKSGTVYLVGPNGLYGIPNPDILASWGYFLDNIVQSNNADLSKSEIAVLSYRTLDKIRPY